MVEVRYTGDELWERIERAIEKVKDRMRRVCTALDSANIPYAIIGGNAVQYWVAQVDESVVRNTRDVDIIINRADLERATTTLEPLGFIYRRIKSDFRCFSMDPMPRRGMQFTCCSPVKRYAKPI